MESLSLGVPVIAANVGGIPDVITDSFNGFVCNSGDINCFINSIVRVYSEKNLQTSLKENARSYAKDKLDIASMNSKYKNLFLSLTKKNDE
jgi:glycosyltransferase involved in cell wall biosynthesis